MATGRYDPTSDLRSGLRGRSGAGGEHSVAGANHLQESIDSLTRAINQATSSGGRGIVGNNTPGTNNGGSPSNNRGGTQSTGNRNGGNWQTNGNNPLTTPFSFSAPGRRRAATPMNRVQDAVGGYLNKNTNVSPTSAAMTMGNMATNFGAAKYNNQTLWDTYAVTSSRNFGGYHPNLMAAKQYTYAGNGIQDTSNALTNAMSYGGYQGFSKGTGGANFMGQAANMANATPGMNLTDAVNMAGVRANPQGQLAARMMGYASPINAQGQTKGTTQQLNDILSRSGVNVSKLNKSQLAGIFNLNNGAVALNMRRLGYNDSDIQAYQQLAQEEVQGMGAGYSQSQVVDALSTSSTSANKGQKQIQKASGVNASILDASKSRDAMTQNRDADQTQSYAGAMEGATRAVNDFSKAMNAFLKSSNLDKLIGSASGRSAVLGSIPVVGKALGPLSGIASVVMGQGSGPSSGTPATAGGSPSSAGTSAPGATGSGAVRMAMSQLGVPYVYGAESPGKAFDCSGLVQWAYSQIGIKIPRVVKDQAAATPKVDPNSAQAGDLLMSKDYGHVMMYMGNGQAVEAPHTGDKVKTIAANPKAWEVHRVVKDAGMGSLVNNIGSPGNKTQTQNNYGGGGNVGSYGSAEEADIISAAMQGPTFGMAQSTRTGATQNGSQTNTGTDMTSKAAALSGQPARSRAKALQMAAARGWTGVEGEDLGLIGDHESGWRVDAKNPTSPAFGIPQANPGEKMASAGPDWRTNDVTQIKWMIDYIAGRSDYGKPSKAWDLWQRRTPHWYDTGTGAGGIHGDQMAMVHDGEIVLNKKNSDLVRAALSAGVFDVKPFPQAGSPPLETGPASLNSTKTGSARGDVNINFGPNSIRIVVPNGNMTDVESQLAAKQVVNYMAQDKRIQALLG